MGNVEINKAVSSFKESVEPCVDGCNTKKEMVSTQGTVLWSLEERLQGECESKMASDARGVIGEAWIWGKGLK